MSRYLFRLLALFAITSAPISAAPRTYDVNVELLYHRMWQDLQIAALRDAALSTAFGSSVFTTPYFAKPTHELGGRASIATNLYRDPESGAHFGGRLSFTYLPGKAKGSVASTGADRLATNLSNGIVTAVRVAANVKSTYWSSEADLTYALCRSCCFDLLPYVGLQFLNVEQHAREVAFIAADRISTNAIKTTALGIHGGFDWHWTCNCLQTYGTVGISALESTPHHVSSRVSSANVATTFNYKRKDIGLFGGHLVLGVEYALDGVCGTKSVLHAGYDLQYWDNIANPLRNSVSLQDSAFDPNDAFLIHGFTLGATIQF